MSTKNTIAMPCIVNIRLYMSAVSRSPWGVMSSMRIIAANDPPNAKAIDTTTMYMIPMRLWSFVRSHDMTVWRTFK